MTATTATQVRVPEPDMPPPEEIWGEGAALAVFHALLPGAGTGCERYRGGLRRIDHGGWECGMAWVGGGRAVLFGYSLEGERADAVGGTGWGTQSRFTVPAVDLLAGGPDWLPWEWLHEVMLDLGIVCFVAWWDGAAWYQAPVPAGMDDRVHDMDDGIDEYVVYELADPDREEDAAAACAELLRAGRERRMDRAVLEALADTLRDPGAADVGAALEEARLLGVAEHGGGGPPVVPAGRGEPAGRRVHQPDGQGGASLSVAMLEAPERERPDPGRGPALEAVLSWMDANGHGAGIRVVHRSTRHRRFDVFSHPAPNGSVDPADPSLLTDQTDHAHHPRLTNPSFSAAAAPSLPARRVTTAPNELLEAWREEEAHPERGRWLCARIHRRGGRTVVERAYDRLPAWQGPVAWDEGGLAALRGETAARAPGWRPEWTPLLDEDFNRDGAPPCLCWRPGLPVAVG
ncbi:hypothetical protein CQJ94_27635 [Glycomyces fuscus]|nr:hypothetical protein CQJ94_27635 [Glycomyces fuscus]